MIRAFGRFGAERASLVQGSVADDGRLFLSRGASRRGCRLGIPLVRSTARGFIIFAIVQFPLAELRPFPPIEPNKLRVPPWPIPIPDKHFVRSFGVVKKRRKGGIDSWP